MRKSETGFDTRTKKKIPPGEISTIATFALFVKESDHTCHYPMCNEIRGISCPKRLFVPSCRRYPLLIRERMPARKAVFSLTPWPVPCIYFVTYLFRAPDTVLSPHSIQGKFTETGYAWQGRTVAQALFLEAANK